MSKIINVVPQNDHTLIIEFEHGNQIVYNMENLLKTIPFAKLNDSELFRNVKFGDKTIYWEDTHEAKLVPLMISVDSILFKIRD